MAGGEKYIAHGILFKYCLDVELSQGKWLFGDKEANNSLALKAGSAEIRGLNTVFSAGITQLRVPFMAMIDFRGYRLSAMSFLPIDKQTLIYGSCDAGKTVKAEDPLVNDLMKELGKRLNLCEHLVGDKVIYGPGDIEVHHSMIDSRYYVLDFARLLPPMEPQPNTPNSIFFRFLRPEFVKSNEIPLCSDAFSMWLSKDPQMTKKNKDIRDACVRLEEVNKQFACSLCRSYKRFLAVTASPSALCSEMHKEGINLSFMGKLRNEVALIVPAPNYKDKLLCFILQEMVARSIKYILKKDFQNITHSIADAGKSEGVIAKVLNFICDPSKQPGFWKEVVYVLQANFRNCPFLPDEEELAFVNLINPLDIINRLTYLCSFKINPDVMEEFDDVQNRQFFPTDIIEITPRVKYMSFIDYIQGVKFLEEVLSAQSKNTPLRHDRNRLLMAREKIQEALNKNSSDKDCQLASFQISLELLKIDCNSNDRKILQNLIDNLSCDLPNLWQFQLSLYSKLGSLSSSSKKPIKTDIPELLGTYETYVSYLRNSYQLWKTVRVSFRNFRAFLRDWAGEIMNVVLEKVESEELPLTARESEETRTRPGSVMIGGKKERPSYTITNTSGGKGIWEYEGEKEETWVRYDTKSQNQIEEAYLGGDTETVLKHGFFERDGYTVTFNPMAQSNNITKNTRNIRRIKIRYNLSITMPSLQKGIINLEHVRNKSLREVMRSRASSAIYADDYNLTDKNGVIVLKDAPYHSEECVIKITKGGRMGGSLVWFFMKNSLTDIEEAILKEKTFNPYQIISATSLNLDQIPSLFQKKSVSEFDLATVCDYVDILIHKATQVNKKESFPSSKFVWEWLDDVIWWEYLPLISKSIEAHYLSEKTGEFEFKWKEGMPRIYQRTNYIINLTKKTQTNAHTTFSRSIRRVSKLKNYKYVSFLVSIWCCYLMMAKISNEISIKRLFFVGESVSTNPDSKTKKEWNEDKPCITNRVITLTWQLLELTDKYGLKRAIKKVPNSERKSSSASSSMVVSSRNKNENQLLRLNVISGTAEGSKPANFTVKVKDKQKKLSTSPAPLKNIITWNEQFTFSVDISKSPSIELILYEGEKKLGQVKIQLKKVGETTVDITKKNKITYSIELIS
eukprot:TRINITY_DN19810_c0_g1_i1.p1 TRINITY_DN19810_c0_g1~~TRINITY_DN19810_c0_g1_i1.p1  ORF type:complete len:1334 (+),score=360.17 TRINITY_DN19810_c0_g1_i1:602-4003(+)